MKSFLKMAAIVLSACAFMGCDKIKDITEDITNHDEYHVFMLNESDKAVTITYSLFGEDFTLKVRGNAQTEIDDTYRWDLCMHGTEIKTVLFTFSDGSSYEHRCVASTDTQGNQVFIFTPEKNNILAGEKSESNPNGSWLFSKPGTNKRRYDYTISAPVKAEE